jgi:26S proteasome regulatory subunit N9
LCWYDPHGETLHLTELDSQEALEFMTGIVEKVDTPTTQNAYVFALVETAAVKLRFGETEVVREELDKATRILDGLDSIDKIVHASFYRVSAGYYGVNAPY